MAKSVPTRTTGTAKPPTRPPTSGGGTKAPSRPPRVGR